VRTERRLALRSVIWFLPAALLAGATTIASAHAADGQQLIYLASWPHQILIFDSVEEKLVDTIQLDSDVTQSLVLSPDKRRLYASTAKDNSIVTVDLATRKQMLKFSLDSGNRSTRFLGLAPDPSGKFLYSIATTVTKLADRYEIEAPKLVAIDIETQKITRAADFPKDESLAGAWRPQMKFSPDGKYLYIFLNGILVFDTDTLKLAKKIDLADPHVPGFANVVFNPVEEESAEDPNEEPGKLTNVFISADPYVHRAVFGIAKIDLGSLTFDFTPVAPATTLSMTPLLITPDHQIGYTAVINGTPGNRRCEFWAFDLPANRRTMTAEFPCRPRFSFGISSDGKHLYLYGAGFEIEVWNAATLTIESTIDLQNDVTMGGIVVVR